MQTETKAAPARRPTITNSNAVGKSPDSKTATTKHVADPAKVPATTSLALGSTASPESKPQSVGPGLPATPQATAAPQDADPAADSPTARVAEQQVPSPAAAAAEPESAPQAVAPAALSALPAAAPAWSDEDEASFQAMLLRRKAAGYQGRGKDVAGQVLRVGEIPPNPGTVLATIVGLVAELGTVARGKLLDAMATTVFPHAKARPADRGWCQGYVAGAIRDGFLAVAGEPAPGAESADAAR